jgi:hypothetical protein
MSGYGATLDRDQAVRALSATALLPPWGFALLFGWEAVVQMAGVGTALSLILGAWPWGWIATAIAAAALYIYALVILLLAALTARLTPWPRTGYLVSTRDRLCFQIHIVVSLFARRTLARWLLPLPFPGSIYTLWPVAASSRAWC